MSPHCSQQAVLCAGWELVFRPATSLLIENRKLNLRTDIEICLSSSDHSVHLQLADVFSPCPTCIKPNVSSSHVIFKQRKEIKIVKNNLNRIFIFVSGVLVCLLVRAKILSTIN